MILRSLIAFTRWVWGISPAFAVADSVDWYPVMVFGMLIDVAAIVALVVVLKDWIQSRE